MMSRSLLLAIVVLVSISLCVAESETVEDASTETLFLGPRESSLTDASMVELGAQKSGKKFFGRIAGWWRNLWRKRQRPPPPRPAPPPPIPKDDNGFSVIEASPPHEGWTGYVTINNQYTFDVPFEAADSRVIVMIHADGNSNGDVIVQTPGNSRHTVGAWRANDWFLRWRVPPPVAQAPQWEINAPHGVIQRQGRYVVTVQYRYGPHGATIKGVKLKVKRASAPPPPPQKAGPPMSSMPGWDLIMPTNPHRGWTGGATFGNDWTFTLPNDVGEAKLVVQAAASGGGAPSTHGAVTMYSPVGGSEVAHWFSESPWMCTQPIWFHDFQWQGPFAGVKNWIIDLPPLQLTRAGNYRFVFQYRSGAHALIIFDARIFKRTALPIKIHNPGMWHWYNFRHHARPANHAALAEPRPQLKLPDPEADGRISTARKKVQDLRPQIRPALKEARVAARATIKAKRYQAELRRVLKERRRINHLKVMKLRQVRRERRIAIHKAQRQLKREEFAIANESQEALRNTTKTEHRDLDEVMMVRLKHTRGQLLDDDPMLSKQDDAAKP